MKKKILIKKKKSFKKTKNKKPKKNLNQIKTLRTTLKQVLQQLPSQFLKKTYPPETKERKYQIEESKIIQPIKVDFPEI